MVFVVTLKPSRLGGWSVLVRSQHNSNVLVSRTPIRRYATVDAALDAAKRHVRDLATAITTGPSASNGSGVFA